MPTSFLIGINYGLIGLCYGWLFGYGVTFVFILKISSRILNFNIYEFIKAISIPVIGSLFMVTGLLFYQKSLIFELTPIPDVIISITFGILLYSIMLFTIKKELLVELISLTKNQK
jgi:hypothetical protein